MDKNKDYFEYRNQKNVEKIREILQDTPNFVKEFFMGIQMTTSVLTRLNYAYDLRIFFYYLGTEKFMELPTNITLDNLNELDSLDIEIFMDYLSHYTMNKKMHSCKDNAKERKLSTLRSFFNYFYKKNKLHENITVKVDMPKLHEKSIVRLNKDEVTNLLNEVKFAENLTFMQKKFNQKTYIRDVAILTLLLGTGIRVSECVGLNRTDINFKDLSFSITRKGGDSSILFFSDEVSSALGEYLNWIDSEIENATVFGNKIKSKNPLFISLQGNRLTVRAIELLVKKYSHIVTPLKKITPHKLRSTYGTALYRATNDIYIVADVLGHKDINTTKKHYAAMSDKIRKDAANKVKLYDNEDELTN